MQWSKSMEIVNKLLNKKKPTVILPPRHQMDTPALLL